MYYSVVLNHFLHNPPSEPKAPPLWVPKPLFYIARKDLSLATRCAVVLSPCFSGSLSLLLRKLLRESRNDVFGGGGNGHSMRICLSTGNDVLRDHRVLQILKSFHDYGLVISPQGCCDADSAGDIHLRVLNFFEHFYHEASIKNTLQRLIWISNGAHVSTMLLCEFIPFFNFRRGLHVTVEVAAYAPIIRLHQKDVYRALLVKRNIRI
mmetsp:Transcript_25968/g.36200  ORF Transcript_25968/g.36200 Transcript_25968/m.36200 type:complete len:208 (+) Transcript_25968:89-712(+)